MSGVADAVREEVTIAISKDQRSEAACYTSFV